MQLHVTSYRLRSSATWGILLQHWRNIFPSGQNFSVQRTAE